jgi:hypothetical protein
MEDTLIFEVPTQAIIDYCNEQKLSHLAKDEFRKIDRIKAGVINEFIDRLPDTFYQIPKQDRLEYELKIGEVFENWLKQKIP